MIITQEKYDHVIEALAGLFDNTADYPAVDNENNPAVYINMPNDLSLIIAYHYDKDNYTYTLKTNDINSKIINTITEEDNYFDTRVAALSKMFEIAENYNKNI